MMLPMVTGSRFLRKKAPQVRLPKSAAVLPMAAQNVESAGTKSLMSRPIGIKYMLATECSNPAATKQVMGKTIDRILSVVDRAEEQSHTARHTRALHMIPKQMAWKKSR